MKNKFINEYNDGDKLDDYLLISSVNKGVTSKGAPYLSFNLVDCTLSIDAKYWNVDEELVNAYKSGMIVNVLGDVISHNGVLQIKVRELKIQNRDDFDLKDFLKASYLSKEELKDIVYKHIESLDNVVIKTLVKEIMSDNEKAFFTYPAASKIHHEYIGGLATHVVEMIEMAQPLFNIYPFLNRDILTAGIILHDIGKVIEFSGPVLAEYTNEGKLLGHISIMQSKIEMYANKIGVSGEEVMLLRHMVLSHHGVYEYGSPVLPMIPEAEALYLLDNLDSRMNALNKTFEITNKGEFTPRLFSLENRSFYKSNV